MDVSCLAGVPFSKYKSSDMYFQLGAGYLICSKVPLIPMCPQLPYHRNQSFQNFSKYIVFKFSAAATPSTPVGLHYLRTVKFKVRFGKFSACNCAGCSVTGKESKRLYSLL